MAFDTENPVASTTRDDLLFWIQQTIHSELDDYTRIPSGLRDRVPALARLIMDEVPRGAFETIRPIDRGLIFFNSDVENAGVVELQSALASAHFSLPKDAPITIYLNSEGGSIYDGLSVNSTINQIQRAGRKVHVHITGTAMSMGSVIVQAASRRTIEAFGSFMLHEVSYDVPVRSPASYHRELLRAADRDTLAMVEEYVRRSGRPKEFFLEQIRDGRDWYLNAKEALTVGLVDEILQSPFALHVVPDAKAAARRKSA